jgi:diguanylate cyclase (GGDEF)-like protein/PAS domain S-box-containing protein
MDTEGDQISRETDSGHALLPDTFQAMFLVAGIGMAVTDRAGRLLAANPALHHLLGFDHGDLIALNYADLVHPDDRDVHAQLYRETLVGRSEPRCLETRYRRKNGQSLWVAVEAHRLPTGDEPPLILSLMTDISDQKRFERHLRYQAQHDQLTGLPNRSLLQERLQRLIHVRDGDAAPFSLLLLGLTRLREINDTFGQRAGDRVLEQIATRLRGLALGAATVSRIGGDQFALLLPHAGRQGATQLAEAILASMARPFDLDEQSVDIDADIGMVSFPTDGNDTRTLLARAESAMQAARQEGTGCAVFDVDVGRRQERRLALARSLRQAIDQGDLLLHYQPKVDFTSGRVDGAEALVRWQHPTYGLLLPGEFIPVAEDAGLIKPLTRWVLHEALRQCRLWRNEGLALRVVVNFSPRVLHDYRLVDMVDEAIAAQQVDASCLGLEITEGAVMADPLRALTILSQLHERGIDISIDDFGTGYSSFAYLDQLPASEIKIDASFVRDMVDNDSHFRIVHGTIDIGHDLGLKTVAEGIEDRETLEALAGLGCDIAQGFYVSHPLPGDEFQTWVQERRPHNDQR